ncbi:MAG: protoheme IX farnesyltransferase, partial [Gammaproteobacteria bacterium]
MPRSAPLTLEIPLRAYFELCKPRVVLLLVFTAMVGMFMATPGMVPLDILILGNLGIALTASGAAAINHVLDRYIDAKMGRTHGRPLPAGQIAPRQAMAFALVLAALGIGILALGVNLLTAFLTFASLIGYAFIYTLYLKWATPQNIVIGGVAGAAPPVLGWTAVTGSLDPHALLLFLIIFVWTPPHFWALAIHRREEYAAAGVPMLP